MFRCSSTLREGERCKLEMMRGQGGGLIGRTSDASIDVRTRERERVRGLMSDKADVAPLHVLLPLLPATSELIPVLPWMVVACSR